jgi:peptidoglycan hydrolase CwlO-like protein
MSNFTKNMKIPIDGFTMIYFPKENYIPAAFAGIAIGFIIAATDFTCRWMFRKIDTDKVESLTNSLVDADNEIEVLRQQCLNKDKELEDLSDQLAGADDAYDELKQENDRLKQELLKAKDTMTFLQRKQTEIRMLLAHEDDSDSD